MLNANYLKQQIVIHYCIIIYIQFLYVLYLINTYALKKMNAQNRN